MRVIFDWREHLINLVIREFSRVGSKLEVFNNVICKDFFKATDKKVGKSFWILEEELLVIHSNSFEDLVDRRACKTSFFGRAVNQVEDRMFYCVGFFGAPYRFLPGFAFKGRFFAFMQTDIILENHGRVITRFFNFDDEIAPQPIVSCNVG